MLGRKPPAKDSEGNQQPGYERVQNLVGDETSELHDSQHETEPTRRSKPVGFDQHHICKWSEIIDKHVNHAEGNPSSQRAETTGRECLASGDCQHGERTRKLAGTATASNAGVRRGSGEPLIIGIYSTADKKPATELPEPLFECDFPDRFCDGEAALNWVEFCLAFPFGVGNRVFADVVATH